MDSITFGKLIPAVLPPLSICFVLRYRVFPKIAFCFFSLDRKVFLATWKDIPAANEVQSQITNVSYSSGKDVVQSCHAMSGEWRDRLLLFVADQTGLCCWQVLHQSC